MSTHAQHRFRGLQGIVLQFRRAFVACLALAALAPTAYGNGNLEWVTAMGGSSSDLGLSIAVDAGGNVYTTGQFAGTADFGPFQLTSAGNVDVFVTKQDPSGTFLWAGAFGSPNAALGRGIAVDATGNVYVAGHFAGTADFDPGPGTVNLTSAGGYDIFVAKLNANGNLIWARTMGGTANDEIRGIALDAAGNVYTTGYFQGTADFNPGPGTVNLTAAGASDVFVSKLDTNGNFVWARAMGGASSDSSLAIAVDGAGNVYTTGYFQGTADFDPGPGTFNLSSVDNSDIFVSKLDTNGSFLWARALGNESNSWGHDIAVDGAGNVHLTGYFQGTVDFDPGPGTFNLSSAGGSDIFVSKLDTNGSFVWARGMGGTAADRGHGIAVDGLGNVYTTGAFRDTVDFDPGPGTFDLSSAGNDDVFVSALNANGNFRWARALGGTSSNVGNRITVDGAGNVLTTGSFIGTADFDPGPGTFNVTSAGGSDIFVLKLSQDTTQPNAIAIAPGTTGPTNAASVAFTVEFDTPVQHFDDESDLVITHSGTAHTGVDMDGGPAVYTVTVEGISGDGSFTLAVSATSDVEDLTGNLLGASVTSDPVIIDNTPPVFSGLDVSPSEAGAGDEVAITFASSEPIAGAPDVLVNGNPASASLKSPFAFSYTVSALDPLGPATIQISGADAAGNAALLEDNVSLVIVEATPGLPAAVPAFAALALLGTALALLHKRPRRRET